MEEWSDRAIKSLQITSSLLGNITNINGTTSKLFELYAIRDELSTNPIAENAATLRKQAKNTGNSLCNITFPEWSNNQTSWINLVKSSITHAAEGTCNLNVCLTNECIPAQNKKKDVILGYDYCTRLCDIAIGLNAQNQFLLYTVAHFDANQTEPNDIKLIGLFEANNAAPALPSDYFGIPINAPVNPNVVPRFKNLQELADSMGKVLSDVSSTNTTVTIEYIDGEPGSLLFGFDFGVNFQTPGVSFSSSLELGDLASVKVSDTELDLSGQFRISTKFGIVFGSGEFNMKVPWHEQMSCTSYYFLHI